MKNTDVLQFDLEGLFVSFYNFITGSDAGEKVADFFSSTWEIMNIVAVPASIILLFGIVYINIKTKQMMKEERDRFDEEVKKRQGENRGNTKWQRIVALVASESPTEWRHGVIEADVILDEALKERGYIGESLGERLKNIPDGSLNNLSAAWDAHKVRNEIAHAGSDFILTQREARRAIDLYRKILDELGVV
jgi:hypothetical protein